MIDYAERARSLVGTRFRPQGRGSHGLDCVGVVLATFGLSPASARQYYRLRGDHETEAKQSLNRAFRLVAGNQPAAGDVMLMRVATDQVHLAVRTRGGFVHAHAGIGRVVETPGTPSWPLLGVYRFRTQRRSR